MLLCMIRHGIAIDREDPESPPEAERYLTDRGMARTREAAKGLRTLGLAPEVILTSPYVRARQTAEIVADVLGCPADTIRETEALLPMRAPEDLFTELCRVQARCVACCGHAPHVDDAVALALGAGPGAFALKKAGAALLDLESFLPPRATLTWLLTAKALRLLARNGR